MIQLKFHLVFELSKRLMRIFLLTILDPPKMYWLLQMWKLPITWHLHWNKKKDIMSLCSYYKI